MIQISTFYQLVSENDRNSDKDPCLRIEAPRQYWGCGLGPAALALFGSISARSVGGVPVAPGCGSQFDTLKTKLNERAPSSCVGVAGRCRNSRPASGSRCVGDRTRVFLI